MPSILFVCTANQFRSPLAAACLRKSVSPETTDRTWKIESAGTWTSPGMPVPTITQQVANRLGLRGLETHRTRQIDVSLLDRFDLVILMEAGHKEALSAEFPSMRKKLYLLSEIVDEMAYDIADPVEPSINPGDVGRELQGLVQRGKEQILRLAETLSQNERT